MAVVNLNKETLYLGNVHDEILDSVVETYKSNFKIKSRSAAARKIIEDWNIITGGRFSLLADVQPMKEKT